MLLRITLKISRQLIFSHFQLITTNFVRVVRSSQLLFFSAPQNFLMPHKGKIIKSINEWQVLNNLSLIVGQFSSCNDTLLQEAISLHQKKSIYFQRRLLSKRSARKQHKEALLQTLRADREWLYIFIDSNSGLQLCQKDHDHQRCSRWQGRGRSVKLQQIEIQQTLREKKYTKNRDARVFSSGAFKERRTTPDTEK